MQPRNKSLSSHFLCRVSICRIPFQSYIRTRQIKQGKLQMSLSPSHEAAAWLRGWTRPGSHGGEQSDGVEHEALRRQMRRFGRTLRRCPELVRWLRGRAEPCPRGLGLRRGEKALRRHSQLFSVVPQGLFPEQKVLVQCKIVARARSLLDIQH